MGPFRGLTWCRQMLWVMVFAPVDPDINLEQKMKEAEPQKRLEWSIFSGWRKRGRGNIYLEAMLPPQVVTERKILKQPHRVFLFFLRFCHSYPLPLTFIKRINLSSSPLTIMWVIMDLGFAFSLVLNAISPGSHLIIFCKLWLNLVPSIYLPTLNH